MKYERSPFTNVSCRWDEVIVEYDGDMYKLVSIEGIRAERLLEFCKLEYGLLWKKRFSENLVGQVLRPLGEQPTDSVSLVLEELTTGEVISVDEAPLTRQNRQAVYAARNAREDLLLSPFTAVHCEDDRAAVQFESRWYELKAINDVDAASILAFCRRRYGDFWERRFAEDLVQVLQEMGQFPKVTVRLSLVDTDTCYGSNYLADMTVQRIGLIDPAATSRLSRI